MNPEEVEYVHEQDSMTNVVDYEEEEEGRRQVQAPFATDRHRSVDCLGPGKSRKPRHLLAAQCQNLSLSHVLPRPLLCKTLYPHARTFYVLVKHTVPQFTAKVFSKIVVPAGMKCPRHAKSLMVSRAGNPEHIMKAVDFL